MRSYASLVLVTAFATTRLLAHEGGHHPAVTDGGHYGGLVTELTAKHEAHDHDSDHNHKHVHSHSHEHESKSKFKAELVRATDRTVHLYIYNDAMNPLDPKNLGNEVKATLAQGSGKKTKREMFSLKFNGKSYMGVSPTIIQKPYAMEFMVPIEGQEQQASFTNLD